MTNTDPKPRPGPAAKPAAVSVQWRVDARIAEIVRDEATRRGVSIRDILDEALGAWAENIRR